MIVHIRVRVKTGSRGEHIEKVGEKRYKISVREKPEQNAANRRVLRLLATELKASIKSIRFISGQKSSSKLFQVVDHEI